MKKNIFLIALFINSLSLFALNEYHADLVGVIKTGENSGEIGYDKNGLPGDGPLTAKIFTIGPDNSIYIYDKYDKKIKIYTLQLEFIKEINVSSYFVFSIYHFKINKNSDIILIDGFGLKKITQNGDLLYEIKRRDLPQEVLGNGNYFPANNYVFYYDDNKNIRCIDPNGNIMEHKAVEKLINKINSNIENKSPNEEEIVGDMLEDFEGKEKLLILQGTILSSNGYFIVNKVYKHLREKKKQTKSDNNSNNIEIKVDGYFLIGYDKENNSYWESDAGFFVFDKYGEFLDSFKRQTIGMGYEAVSPAGDVYFWEVKPDGVFFYKITRRW